MILLQQRSAAASARTVVWPTVGTLTSVAVLRLLDTYIPPVVHQGEQAATVTGDGCLVWLV